MPSADFPWLYQAHQGRYQDDLDFWRGCVAAAHRPVLELGCGPGRVTLPLAREGHVVLALDRDPWMLRVLQSRLAPTLRPRVHPILADMASFALRTACLDVVICPCNTLSTLEDEALAGTLGRVARHLRPQGRFVASLPNPQVMASLPESGPLEVEDVFAHPRTGHPVQVMTAWRRDPRRLHVCWHYDHLFPDGRVERLSVTLHHRLDGPGFYAQAFQRAGLRLCAVYGDFERRPYAPDAPYLILEACREGG